MGKRKRSGSFSNDDGDSQEEMDGETLVVHKGNIVNGIRYSARVQEKQEKLRREASPSKQIVADITCTTTVILPCQSTVKTPIGEEIPEVIPVENTFVPQPIIISGEKKKKRTWELWSQEDKQLFFEALNEFGKDFELIQNYLASKLKPRSKGSCSLTVPKNKDQVRHFYYRTWNKISKYLTFPKDMKKAFQELYGLVNYGELRKKQRVLNSKTAVKLSELVEKGTTTIKVRGKTFRIKTPVCRALKRLNQLEDVDHIRVPCKLCVELVPHDGDTWTSIQRVSHNPRVKTYVPLQRTLASLIIYFEERWKTDESRLKEEFSLTMFGRPRTRLRFFPVDNRDLSVPIFKFSETTSATKISLNAYKKNCLFQEQKPDSVLGSKNIKRKPKPANADTALYLGSTAQRDSEYFAAETDASDAEGTPENQFRITLRRDRVHSGSHVFGFKPSEFYGDNENSNGFQDASRWCVHEENANAAIETDAAEIDYGFDDIAPSPTECDENTGDEDCNDPILSDNVILFGIEEKQCTCGVRNTTETDESGASEKQDKQCTCEAKKICETEDVGCRYLDTETLIRGWNANEAGTITLGEIYLMLGKSDKLCFEYTWDKCEEDRIREDRASNLVDKLIGIARHLKKKKSNRAKSNLSIVGADPGGLSCICIKCNVKMESLGGSETEPSSTASAVTSTKDIPEPVQFDSPQRTNSSAQLNDSAEENKLTLHADVESPVMTDCKRSDTSAVDLNVISSSDTSPQDPTPLPTKQDLEVANTKHEETISGQSHGSVLIDSIISAETISSPSNVCSIQSAVTSQTGLIDISALACSTDNFRRVAPNIQATIIPTSTAIIRSVALTNCFTDSHKGTLSCHSTGLTPVTTTTTVLLSEPAVFAGISGETSSFVTIQQCSTGVSVSPPPLMPHNTQDTKFRRPADVPILMKPCSDDRSTNEDGTVKISVPKPFLDLPKGNRRIGRRPAWKQRVIIPRMLPLLPKPNDSILKAATMATLITLPPVVATGLSVVPLSADVFTSAANLSIASQESITTVTTLTPATVTYTSGLAVAVSSLLPPEAEKCTISQISGNTLPTPCASTSSNINSTSDTHTVRLDSSSSKATDGHSLPASNRTNTGFEENLDSLSLSSFMDISIPESTRFIASDLRLEEFEYSNSSMSLSGMLEETSRKNARDPPMLDTPKKQKNGDSQIDIPSPPRLTPLTSLETSWPGMSEGSDLFMGSFFSGHETLPSNSTEGLSESDLNFQSVMSENGLDFESKLEFSSVISENSKD